MSYKTHKRRLQRLKFRVKIKFWANVRKHNADAAFEEWKKVHVDIIRGNYLNEVQS